MRKKIELAVLLLFLAVLVLLSKNLQKLVSSGNVTAKNKIIVLDSGHGGDDPGKIGVNQAKEKDVNLEIARKIKKGLEKKGWEVVMTREKDEMLGDPQAGNKKIHDMKARVEIINKTMPQAAVSIHQNSYQDEQIRGAQVFYYSHSEEGKRMAEQMQKALLTVDETRHANRMAGAVHSNCPVFRQWMRRIQDRQKQMIHTICSNVRKYRRLSLSVAS